MESLYPSIIKVENEDTEIGILCCLCLYVLVSSSTQEWLKAQNGVHYRILHKGLRSSAHLEFLLHFWSSEELCSCFSDLLFFRFPGLPLPTSVFSNKLSWSSIILLRVWMDAFCIWARPWGDFYSRISEVGWVNFSQDLIKIAALSSFPAGMQVKVFMCVHVTYDRV